MERMRWELICGAAMLALWAPAAGRAAGRPAPVPPRLLLVTGLNQRGELLVPTYQNVTRLPARPEDKPTGSSHETTLAVSLEGVLLFGGDGKPVPTPEFRKRLAGGTAILVASGGTKPASVFFRVLSREALVLVFPGAAPVFTPAQWPVEKSADGVGGVQP